MQPAVGTSLLVIVLNLPRRVLGLRPPRVRRLRPGRRHRGVRHRRLLLGSALAHRVQPASLRRAFAVFVLAMGSFILVREGALVARTAGSAAEHAAQLLFALAMLAVGIGAARLAELRRAVPETAYLDGEGI